MIKNLSLFRRGDPEQWELPEVSDRHCTNTDSSKGGNKAQGGSSEKTMEQVTGQQLTYTVHFMPKPLLGGRKSSSAALLHHSSQVVHEDQSGLACPAQCPALPKCSIQKQPHLLIGNFHVR